MTGRSSGIFGELLIKLKCQSNARDSFTQRRKGKKDQRRKEEAQAVFFAPSVFLFFAPLREIILSLPISTMMN
jgi:hypothetical protein